jgi:enoyl-CoA hydratase
MRPVSQITVKNCAPGEPSHAWASREGLRGVGSVAPVTVRIEPNGADGEVWTIVIDRPEARNAVDGPTAEALARAMRDFDADGSARVAVLCGAGGTFCAGADLKQMSNRLDPDLTTDAPMGPSRLALDKPVIAAINGFAVAGGLELAAWCDLRVMESDAVVGVFCRRWGVPLIDGGTVRLPRIIGLGRALDLILTGRSVGADEALAMGLVNRVVAPGTARPAAEALAAELAAFPQACLRSDRRSVYDALAHGELDALGIEFGHGLDSVRAEGVRGAARFSSGEGRHGTFGS